MIEGGHVDLSLSGLAVRLPIYRFRAGALTVKHIAAGSQLAARASLLLADSRHCTSAFDPKRTLRTPKGGRVSDAPFKFFRARSSSRLFAHF